MSKEVKWEFNFGGRYAGEDLVNLMKCLKKQDKYNKPILYAGRYQQKVILSYEQYQKISKKEQAWDIAVKKRIDLWHLVDLIDQDYEMYIAFCKSEKYEEDYILTEEEFNLLKECL